MNTRLHWLPRGHFRVVKHEAMIQQKLLKIFCKECPSEIWVSFLSLCRLAETTVVHTKSSPFSISTRVSPGDIQWYGPLFSSSGWVACSLIQLTPPGMINVNSCFPVHRGFGFKIAGIGSFPSQVGRNMTRVIISSFVKNTSLFVIFLTAVRVSCTIPMTGLFDCGVMIWRGVKWMFKTSAL